MRRMRAAQVLRLSPSPRHRRAAPKRDDGSLLSSNRWAWDDLKRATLARDRWQCQACGGRAVTVDHIRPRAQGGTDDSANLQSLCGPCHVAKTKAEAQAAGARMRELWREAYR